MPESWQVGDRIAGRYEVFEVYRGGMGEVYAVRDHIGRTEGQLIALKTLSDEYAFEPVSSARFATECHLWIRLGTHDHVVRAYRLETLEGKPYVVMEYVTGGDLRRLIGDPQLDVITSLRLGVEFCLGMEHAIRQGLRCHRDIKPGNLLLTENGRLKIGDFGLAGIRDELLALALEHPDDPIPLVEVTSPQAIVWTDPRDLIEPPVGVPSREGTHGPRVDGTHNPESASDGNVGPSASGMEGMDDQPLALESTEDDRAGDPRYAATIDLGRTKQIHSESKPQSLTRTGRLMGTLPYMAPEQFRDAKSVDIRADIYSFGIVLFEMLTSRRPFLGNSLAKLERQHSAYDPPSVAAALSKRFAKEAESIDSLVQRCLQKDRVDRFATINDLRRDLTRILRRIDPHFDPRR
jgi:serine/threonine protein kinase